MQIINISLVKKFKMKSKNTSIKFFVSILLCMCVHTLSIADVQVLFIRDVNVLSSSPSATDPSGIVGPAVEDGLCVINTEIGKGVRLSFSSAHGIGSDGVSWQMRDVSTGESVLYRQSASIKDIPGEFVISGASGGAYIDVPAVKVVNSAAACPAAGNVRKRVILSSPPRVGGQWSDTVTLRATSL